jgi:hypothetical protein
MPIRIVDRPLHCDADEGLLLIDGGAGVVVTMTPEAASATAERLMACVAEAVAESGVQPSPRADVGGDESA